MMYRLVIKGEDLDDNCCRCRAWGMEVVSGDTHRGWSYIDCKVDTDAVKGMHEWFAGSSVPPSGLRPYCDGSLLYFTQLEEV